MYCPRGRLRVFAVACGMAMSVWSTSSTAVCRGRGLSVPDLIGLTTFDTHSYGGGGSYYFVEKSPDGRYVAAFTQRADLSANKVIDEIRIWNVDSISRWLAGSRLKPEPVATVSMGAADESFHFEASTIRDMRWAGDSGSLYFRGREQATGSHAYGLYRMTVKGDSRLISLAGQNVVAYEADSGTVVEEVEARAPALKGANRTEKGDGGAIIVGTDRSIYSILSPNSKIIGWVHLWEVGPRSSNPRLVFKQEINSSLLRSVVSISSSGRYVILDLPVHYLPRSWMSYGHEPGRPIWTHVGVQNLRVAKDDNSAIPHEYTLVDLTTGKMRALLDAPDAFSRGFYGLAAYDEAASWSPDDSMVLLRGAFLPLAGKRAEQGDWGVRRPCIAIVDVRSGSAKCVVPSGGPARSAREIAAELTAHWIPSMPDRLLVAEKGSHGLEEWVYCVNPNGGRWFRNCESRNESKSKTVTNAVRIWVMENINSPPELVAALPGSTSAQVLYDPNAEVRGRCRGQARVIQLTYDLDGSEEKAEAGLLLPPGYSPKERYPLVLQTHGFLPWQFFGSGIYSAPFAGQALASAGMVVMQLPICSPGSLVLLVIGTPKEAQCSLAIFRAAIRYALDHGLADRNKIGIIGFSRTCYTVLLALEDPEFHLAAAELSDGIELTYTEYMLDIAGDDPRDWMYLRQMESNIGGGPPIGASLPLWVRASPGFSVYKIHAPVLTQASSPMGLLGMWEPYATLRRLHRPAEAVYLRHMGEHPIENPSQRLAVQDLTVDWFRFWLQGIRPENEPEYRRWAKMRAETPGAGAIPDQSETLK